MSGTWPSYLELHESGELVRRAEQATGLLGPICTVCPRECSVDRLDDQPGLCAVGRRAVVSSCFAHMGEEDCLRGQRGSGTIFFSGCNLKCVFCQNHDISWKAAGQPVSSQRLAEMMLELQALGCHNINWVTPEHVVPQILEALPDAVAGGFNLPIVYNTSAYDSIDSLRLLDGVVDIYMPDFKLWSTDAARLYLRKRDYPDVAREAIKEMHRQVDDLEVDENGLARRGVLVRHLVMPGLIDETESILRFLATEISTGTYLNLMDQYFPAGLVGSRGRFKEIGRRLTSKEYAQAIKLAEGLGLKRLDHRKSPNAILGM